MVAGRFYPADNKELLGTIQSYMKADEGTPPVEAVAAVAPHAGYIYSGQLAAKTLQAVSIAKTVLLLGPNHTGKGQPVSLSAESWSTPLGNVPIEKSLLSLIEGSTVAAIDEEAHRFEHSLEVQLPFLQVLQPQLSIVPLTIKQLSFNDCELVAKQLAEVITAYKQKVFIVASTDMSHYESRKSAEKKDRLALKAIEAMDPLGLYTTVQDNKISMCGFIPVVITILLSQILGANRASIVGYMDSGAVSGDVQQVVGYAGVIIQ